MTENLHTDVACCCIIATTIKWDHVSLFRLQSSTFVYSRLVIRLHLSTLVYIRLHASVTRLHLSALVYARLVTRLYF